MNQIIVTTESQLRDFIARAISVELRNALEFNQAKQPTSSPIPDILNVKQAAEVLDLAPSTVYGLVNKSLLPHYKKGGKLRFKRSQLLEWIDSGEKKTRSQAEQKVNICTSCSVVLCFM